MECEFHGSISSCLLTERQTCEAMRQRGAARTQADIAHGSFLFTCWQCSLLPVQGVTFLDLPHPRISLASPPASLNKTSPLWRNAVSQYSTCAQVYIWMHACQGSCGIRFTTLLRRSSDEKSKHAPSAFKSSPREFCKMFRSSVPFTRTCFAFISRQNRKLVIQSFDLSFQCNNRKSFIFQVFMARWRTPGSSIK